MKAIGMMSGTSLDGITAALVETGVSGKNLKVLAYKTYPYTKCVQKLILDTIASGGVQEVSFLNFFIGKLYAETAKKFLKEFSISPSDVKVIGMHGQTVFHTAEKVRFGRFSLSHTLQIGEPAFVAAETGVTVVSNFRAKDIAFSGQGAPLIPMFDLLVFARKGKRIAVQNLGGIGNVTVLSGTDIGGVFAFDTGPCNMVLDGATRLLYGKSYDRNGAIARSGKVIDELFHKLAKTPYLKKRPPKSAGRTEFGDAFLKEMLKGFENARKKDIIATLNKFVAFTVFDAYKRFAGKLDYAVLSGGGVFNKTLVDNIKEYLEVPVYFSDKFNIPAEAKESAAFALYALRTLYKLPSNVKKATGASKETILGVITYAK